MVRKDLRSLREEYASHALLETEAPADPLEMFGIWFDQAMQAGIAEPNAMTLATTNEEGRPAARVVLLKELDHRGFVFFTNYQSQKGKQLAANPHACLVFLWLELQRQVRISGHVERIAPEESDHYFMSRPRESQLGALASPQSQPVPSRQALEENFQKVKQAWAGKDIVRPAHWGGYRLIPDALEFWQGRPGRMHDRLLYTRIASVQHKDAATDDKHGKPEQTKHHQTMQTITGIWNMERLAP